MYQLIPFDFLIIDLTHYRAGFSSVQSSQRKYIIDNKYLDKTEKDDETEVFLIYINRPFDVNALKSFHKLSSYTIMADGGANRLHEKFQSKYVRYIIYCI